MKAPERLFPLEAYLPERLAGRAQHLCGSTVPHVQDSGEHVPPATVQLWQGRAARVRTLHFAISISVVSLISCTAAAARRRRGTTSAEPGRRHRGTRSVARDSVSFSAVYTACRVLARLCGEVVIQICRSVSAEGSQLH